MLDIGLHQGVHFYCRSCRRFFNSGRYSTVQNEFGLVLTGVGGGWGGWMCGLFSFDDFGFKNDPKAKSIHITEY